MPDAAVTTHWLYLPAASSMKSASTENAAFPADLPDAARGCPAWISRRPVSRTAERRDDREHLVVDSAVAGHDVPLAGSERPSVHPRHAAPGLLHHQRGRGDIPRMEPLLPETIHAAGTDITEIERRGAEAAHGARAE